MNLWHEFLDAFNQSRFEGERSLSKMPIFLMLKITVLFVLSTLLFALSMIVISLGFVKEGFEAGVWSCLGIFFCSYLHGIYQRGKSGYYDKPFGSGD